MTVRDIYDQRIKDLPAIDQLRLARLILDQLTSSEAVTDLDEQIRLNTPSHAELLKAAASHGPPQEWWDAGDDPTVASKGQ